MSEPKTYTYNDFTGTVEDIIDNFNFGFNPRVIYNRLYHGMTIEEALENPSAPCDKNIFDEKVGFKLNKDY